MMRQNRWIFVAVFAIPLTLALQARAETKMKTSDVQPLYGTTNPTPQQQSQAPVQRYAAVVELVPEKEEEYRRLHADVWPEVVAAIKRANIQNYSIYVTEIAGKKYLLSYLEYTGDDAERDFASMGQNPTIRDRWWPLTNVCQQRLPGTAEGEQWLPAEMAMYIP